MKRIFTLFILTFLIVILYISAGYAQEKTDNTIVVKNVSWEAMITKLVDKGFVIDASTNEKYGSLKTGEYPYSSVGKLYIQIRYKDSTAYINCYANMGMVFMGQHSGYMKLQFRGTKNSDARKCATIWKCYAESLNGEISYAKL